jgi:hypothetical protein
MQAFEAVKKQLLGRLHDIARAQIFPFESPAPGASTGPDARPPSPSSFVQTADHQQHHQGLSGYSTLSVLPGSAAQGREAVVLQEQGGSREQK